MRAPQPPAMALLGDLPLAVQLLVLAGLLLCGWAGLALAVAWLAATMR